MRNLDSLTFGHFFNRQLTTENRCSLILATYLSDDDFLCLYVFVIYKAKQVKSFWHFYQRHQVLAVIELFCQERASVEVNEFDDALSVDHKIALMEESKVL